MSAKHTKKHVTAHITVRFECCATLDIPAHVAEEVQTAFEKGDYSTAGELLAEWNTEQLLDLCEVECDDFDILGDADEDDE